MKRIIIFIVFLLLSGMSIFAQSPDMSFYTDEYNRSDATMTDMLDILRMVKDENLTGIGSFYQNAVVVYIQRLPNYTNPRDRMAVEETARLILRGLAAEKHVEAAPQIWFLIQYFDISQQINSGYIMYEGLVAMGQVGAKDYTPPIVGILESYNARTTTDPVAKGRVQLVVPACINALENLSEPLGVKPIFFASIGWYDNDIKAIALTSVINLMGALGDVISDVVSDIIKDHFNGPVVKLAAWDSLLRSNAPNNAKAKVAIVALEASFNYSPTAEAKNASMRMRMSTIDVIRVFGVEDDSVYAFLERTYRESFAFPAEFEYVVKVIRALSVLKTDESITLLTDFLRELNTKRRSGPWGDTERNILFAVINDIAATGTQSPPTIQLLTVISRSSIYTGAEQTWARNALTKLTGR